MIWLEPECYKHACIKLSPVCLRALVWNARSGVPNSEGPKSSFTLHFYLVGWLMCLLWKAVMGYPVACNKADWHRKAGLEGSVSTSILWARNSGEEQEKPQVSSRTLNYTVVKHPRASAEPLGAPSYKDAEGASPSPAIKASMFHQPPQGQ